MNTNIVVRPVRIADAESLGRVHVECWHQTYGHLFSQDALAKLNPKRVADLWASWVNLGEGYKQAAAVIDDEIIGFASSGPARDADAPAPLELYNIYLLEQYQGSGAGQMLFDAVIGEDPAYLFVADDNPRAHSFYARNAFTRSGYSRVEEVLAEEITEVQLVRA